MILKELGVEIEESSSIELKEKRGTIDQKNIDLVMSLVSSNIYSNNIGSIVREITSNCYDANKENNSSEPIKIYYENDYENNTRYIVFEDNGKGLSPELMDEVYMCMFSSTKRDDNLAHGGWGLGSKTPFSYVNQFNLVTICNNIKYEYLLYKESIGFKYTCLSSNETLENSGTKIKIEVDQKDLYKFNQEFKYQLKYFEDVYIQNNSGHYYSNDFKLIEGKNFKYNNLYSTGDLHICLGQVSYPIDFKVLELNRNLFNFPLALKFNIGELPVTLSRENIDYTEETIKTIKSKINLLLEELKELKEKSGYELNDIVEYIKRRNVKLDLKLSNDISLNTSNMAILADNHIFKDFSYVFSPLKDIKIPYNPFFYYEEQQIENGVIYKARRYSRDFNITNHKFAIVNDFNDKYNNIIFNNGYLLKKKVLNKDLYRSFKSLLNLSDTGDFFKYYLEKYFTLDEKESTVKEFYCDIETREVGTVTDYRNINSEPDKIYYNWGKAKNKPLLNISSTIRKYIKEIDKQLKDKATEYYIADEEWINEYKLNLKLQRGDIIRNKEEVFFKEVVSANKNYYRKKIKLQEFAPFYYVFYFLEEHDLNEFKYFVSQFSLWKNNKICLVLLSESNLPSLKRCSNVYDAEEIKVCYLDNSKFKKIFYNHICSLKLYKMIDDENFNIFQTGINNTCISEYYFNLVEELTKFEKKYNLPYPYNYSYLDKLNLQKFKNKKNIDIKKILLKLIKEKEKFEIFNHIPSNFPIKYANQLIKQNTKILKLNPKFYKNHDNT